MKILSKKKYCSLIEEIKELKKKCNEFTEVNEKITKKLEDKKTSCKLNKGNDFCFDCKNSFKYKTYWGTIETERCGCLLDIPCENFERKEDK